MPTNLFSSNPNRRNKIDPITNFLNSLDILPFQCVANKSFGPHKSKFTHPDTR